jgi:flavorubredoxin
MSKRIDEVATGIYRIGEFNPDYGITMNQFLIVDERPALVHTGTHPMYDGVRKAVAEIIDPKRLEFVVVPHFEADECGGMGRFVREAPRSTLLCSEMGAAINLSGWDFAGPFKGMRDGSVIELGKHRLRFIETPHVHHWDSMMVFEETTQSLFPADLFIQPGEQSAFTHEDLGEDMCKLYRDAGIFAGERPVLQCVDRIEKLNPKCTHPMHGGSLTRQALAAYVRALRTKPFVYEGKLLGRNLAT